METYTPVPADGWENYERAFLRSIVVTMYKRLRSPVMKFMVIAHYEGGYTQEEVARMVGCSQANVNNYLKRAKHILFRAKKNNLL